MRKLLLFAALSFFAFTGKVQELNFEETVRYINNRIKCCQIFEECRNDTISVSKKGELLKWYKGKLEAPQNLFDLMNSSDFKYIESYKTLLAESNGILLQEYYQGKFFNISLLQTQKNMLSIASFKTKVEADRIYKALLHLLTLCSKEKDPFDN